MFDPISTPRLTAPGALGQRDERGRDLGPVGGQRGEQPEHGFRQAEPRADPVETAREEARRTQRDGERRDEQGHRQERRHPDAQPVR